MKFVFILVICVFAFYLYVRYLEKNTIFFPDKEITLTPADNFYEYEDVYIESDGNKIHGWWIPAEGATKTIIYLHGNAGNISGRLEKLSIFRELGINSYIIDYRGYGKSEGMPSEQGLYDDANAAYDYLVQQRGINPEDIIIYGASLGGAVAVDLASQVDCYAVILNSTFSNAVDMAKVIYPFIPSFLVNIKLDSSSKIGKIKAPKLFIHSDEDRVVPFSLGVKLYEQAPAPKEFIKFVGDHVNAHVFEYDRYKKVIGSFIKGIK